MVEHLLEYARLGSEAVAAERIDCDRLVSELVEARRFEMADREATVEVGDLPTIRGDEHLLWRLFQNLLSNALAYAGDAPPEIAVTARQTTDGWEFAVSDRGEGFDPDRTRDVFAPFTRGNRTNDHD